MRPLLVSIAVSSIALAASGCLPSRRGQQPAAPSGGQAPVQPQGPPPTVPPYPNQPQPQPQPQPGGNTGGMVIPGMMGMPPIALPWPVQPGAGTASPGSPAPGGAPSPFPFPLPFPIPGMGGSPVDPTFPPAWASLEDGVVAEVNARRAQGANCGGQAFGPAGPLSSHPGLRQAARLHSRDMGAQNYFDHTSLDGRQVGDRLRASGYGGGYYGENIAAGRATARETVEQWMASPGHCSNIMQPGFRYVGVGYAYAQNSRFGHYWTQDFGG